MLQRSSAAKVANAITPAGRPRICNSFGLPSGKANSCPGATPTCERVCYAGRLEQFRPEVRATLARNWELVRGASHRELVRLIGEMVRTFEGECDRWDAPKVFRIHWDGDFYSDDYAAAWALVIRRHPRVKFWAYTRTESAYRLFHWAELDNLAIYFSGDPDNLETARQLQREGGRVAMLAETFADARAAMPAKAVACPEQMGRLPLAGACLACGACIRGRSNIAFSIKRK